MRRLLSGVMVCFLIGCQSSPAEEATPRKVRTARVERAENGRLRTFSGHAQASIESNLSFRVTGALEALHAHVGDHVRQGALLAELDPTDLRLQAERAEASLHRAEAEARNAQAHYERVRLLYESHSAALTELDLARAAAEGAGALVEEAQKQLALARKQLGYTRLTAPSEGTVVQVVPEVNENLPAGTPVVRLAAGREIEVVISLPERLINQVSKEQVGSVTFDALPGVACEGSVCEIGVSSLYSSTTFPVTLAVADSPKQVRSGMAATVSLRFPYQGKAPPLLVPSAAVGEDLEGRYVYLLEPTVGLRARVHRQSVEVGELTSDGIEVTAGLEPGALIAIAGLRHLKEGMEVTLPLESESDD